MGLFGFGKRKKQIIAYQDEYFSLMHKQQYAEAVAVCEQLLKLEYWDARGLMGDAYGAMGDKDNMLRMYKEGLRKASSAAAYRGYAEYLLEEIGPAPDFPRTTGYAEFIDFEEKAKKYLKIAKDHLDQVETSAKVCPNTAAVPTASPETAQTGITRVTSHIVSVTL
ncbi:MAG: hypothetical protein IKM31_01585, partial [Oscillospiraceae bacterium]|nr:hypothetical protein [Oscillospiraceae bacterium]